MWTLIVIGIVWGLWKIRPRHLMKDVLELEWMKELQDRRHMRPVSAEELEHRWVRQLTVRSAVCGVVVVVLALAVGIPAIPSLMVGCGGTATTAIVVSRSSRHYRQVVQPLYLTLCGLQGMLWDTHSPARKWVTVSKKGQSGAVVVVRLPKEWHSSERGIKSIVSVVSSRIPGREWAVKVEQTRFRVVLTEKVVNTLDLSTVVDVIPVTVSSVSTPTTLVESLPGLSASMPSAANAWDLREETNDDDSPW